MNILPLTLVILRTEEGIININTRTVVALSSTRTPGPPTSNIKTSASLTITVYMRTTPDGCPPILASFCSQELLQITLPCLLRDYVGALLGVAYQRRGDLRGLGDAGFVVTESFVKDDLHEHAAPGNKPVLIVSVVAWYKNPGAT